MEKAVELVIIIISLYYVGLPLFRRKVYGAAFADSVKDEKLHKLFIEKENTYRTIKDIQFDFKAGKISQEDHDELVAKYETEAMEILKRIDTFKKNIKKGTSGKKKRP